MIFGREKHTVNGQSPGQWVHESVVPQVSLSLETYWWDPRVRVKTEKEKGKKGEGYWAGSAQVAQQGSAQARGSAWASACRPARATAKKAGFGTRLSRQERRRAGSAWQAQLGVWVADWAGELGQNRPISFLLLLSFSSSFLLSFFLSPFLPLLTAQARGSAAAPPSVGLVR